MRELMKLKKEILSNPFFSYVAHPIMWSLIKHEPSLGGRGGDMLK